MRSEKGKLAAGDATEVVLGERGVGSGPRRGRRWMAIAVVAFVGVWLTVMLFRMEIRAQWWAYRLARVESRQERNYYVACLAAIGDKSLGAVDRLIEDPRPEIREIAATVLHYCPGDRARRILLDLLGDESEIVSSRAALELARREDASGAIPVLEKMLTNADVRSARSAAVALGRISSPEVEQILIYAAAMATHPDVQAQVVDSLAMLHSKAAVPILIDMLTDDRPITTLPASQRDARRAIVALQQELAAKGVDPQALLERTPTESTLASVAARGLQLITGVSFGDPATQPAGGRDAVQRRWQQWWEQRGRGGNGETERRRDRGGYGTGGPAVGTDAIALRFGDQLGLRVLFQVPSCPFSSGAKAIPLKGFISQTGERLL